MKVEERLTRGDRCLLPRPARTLSPRTAVCRAGALSYRLRHKGKGRGSGEPRWPSSCTLEGPGSWSGTVSSATGAALIGVLEACKLVSLGLTIVLGVKGLGVVSLAWDFCTPHLLSSVQKP